MSRKFPFKAWAFTPTFKLEEIIVIRQSSCGMYCSEADPKTGIYKCSLDVFETPQDAINAGFNALNNEQYRVNQLQSENSARRDELLMSENSLHNSEGALGVGSPKALFQAWHIEPGLYVVPVTILGVAGRWNESDRFQSCTIYSGHSLISGRDCNSPRLLSEKDLFVYERDALMEAVNRLSNHVNSMEVGVMNGRNLLKQLNNRLDQTLIVNSNESTKAGDL